MNSQQNLTASMRSLTRSELNELEQLVAELARLTDQRNSLVFVLGSYHPMKKTRLRNVCEALESQSREDICARLMEDFIPESDGNLNGHYKFKHIARYADALVGVVEDDRGGFTYEQGIIVDNPQYFEKTFVLKKSYAPIIEQRKYSWMQSTSLFEELEHIGRIYEWGGNNKQNFPVPRDKLVSDVEQYL